MVGASWSKPEFFRHTVSETGWGFGREMRMWYLPKLTVWGFMLKEDNRFEATVE